MDNKVKVLWISDIHFEGDYENFEKKIGNFFLLQEIKNVDYIIISGDIVGRSNKKNYDGFKLFLEDIRTKTDNKNANVLVVPGNHDVERDYRNQKQAFINAILDKSKENRNIFLSNDNFRKYFIGVFEKFNDFKTEFAPKIYVKSDDETCGYFLDKKNKLLFVMLNSAWFSLGEAFLEQYLDNLGKPPHNRKEIEALLNGIGKQMTGLDSINKKFATDLIDVIEMYPEYLMVTTMHHPPHWLHEQQRFNKKKNPNLHKILLKTDLLLTGHEHAPLSIGKQIISQHTCHLQGGCFLEDDNFHWFSLLEINSTKKNVRQIKFNYEKNIWKNNLINFERLHRKYPIIIGKKRLEDLRRKLFDNFKNMTKDIINNDENGKKTTSTIEDNSYFLVVNTKDSLHIFIKEFNKNEIINYLNKIIFEKSIVKTKIKFHFFDLFRSEWISNYTQKDRVDVITKINKKHDFIFDDMRQKFFSSLDESRVKIIKNTRFVNKTHPFWSMEKFID